MSTESRFYLFENGNTWGKKRGIVAGFQTIAEFADYMDAQTHEEALERMGERGPGLSFIPRGEAADRGLVPLLVRVTRRNQYAAGGVLTTTEEVELMGKNRPLKERVTMLLEAQLEDFCDEEILEGVGVSAFVAKRTGDGLDWLNVRIDTHKECARYVVPGGESCLCCGRGDVELDHAAIIAGEAVDVWVSVEEVASE